MTNNLHTTTNNTGIIFIHGAGLGGWIWKDVVKEISVPYVCIDYGKIYRGSNYSATLADYIQTAYEQAEQLDVERIVIIAHSVGGVVGIELAKRLESKTAAFMGVCAAIPKPGGNFVSALPFPQKFIMPLILKLAGTKPPESAIRSGLGSGLTDKQSDEIVAQFQPESAHLFTDKTSKGGFVDTPTFYIRTTNDKEFGVPVQNASIANLTDSKVFEITSGHMPMLSDPNLVSAHIHEMLKTVA